MAEEGEGGEMKHIQNHSEEKKLRGEADPSQRSTYKGEGWGKGKKGRCWGGGSQWGAV